jgi:molybdenum cofactor guanylyltransferase
VTLGGIVLAGGKSRRMGSPKAWLRIDGVTLLERAVAVLGEMASPVIISAAAGQELPMTGTVIRDAVPDRGPMGGIHAGLTALPGCDAVLVLAIDMPFMTAAVLRDIVTTFEKTQADAVVPMVDGVLQPLAAVYRRTVLPTIDAQLNAGDWALHAFVAKLATVVHVVQTDRDRQAFQNWNTPADMTRDR